MFPSYASHVGEVAVDRPGDDNHTREGQIAKTTPRGMQSRVRPDV